VGEIAITLAAVDDPGLGAIALYTAVYDLGFGACALYAAVYNLGFGACALYAAVYDLGRGAAAGYIRVALEAAIKLCLAAWAGSAVAGVVLAAYATVGGVPAAKFL